MRKLVLTTGIYRFRTTHRHHTVGAGPVKTCQELFSAYLDGFPRSPLRLLFTETDERGAEYIRRAGVVQVYQAVPLSATNLNLPATARALIERALVAGWNPRVATRPFELDGWTVIEPTD